MSESIVTNENSLSAYKERLLKEIKYYDFRIEEARSILKSNSIEDEASSDSDSTISLPLGIEPPIGELQKERSMLKTCIQATQELTGLEILQVENNILDKPPVLDGELSIEEPGTWRLVVTECRVDLVPFSLSFYSHQADRKYAPVQYRNLKVKPLKSAHEMELSRSVLPALKRPSDVVEVIRNYAVEYRSRRTSLARLAERFASHLHMEPWPEGRYVLKCADLLTLYWMLQNKWSPVARFHHKINIDLEYMDESYIKTIALSHRQLSEPDMGTDERTEVLTKIIDTCLEAQGPTEEKLSLDPESARILKSRRTSFAREIQDPTRTSQDDAMAPPKTVPKKRSAKRTIDGKASLGSAADIRNSSNKGKSENIRKTNKQENIGDGKTVVVTSHGINEAMDGKVGDNLNSDNKVKKGVKRTIDSEHKDDKKIKNIDKEESNKKRMKKGVDERKSNYGNIAVANPTEKVVNKKFASNTDSKNKKKVKKNVASKSDNIVQDKPENSVAVTQKAISTENTINKALKNVAKKPNIDKKQLTQGHPEKAIKKAKNFLNENKETNENIKSNEGKNVEKQKNQKMSQPSNIKSNFVVNVAKVDTKIPAKKAVIPKNPSNTAKINKDGNSKPNIKKPTPNDKNPKVLNNAKSITKMPNSKFASKPSKTGKENIQKKTISKIPQKHPVLSALKSDSLRMSPRRLGSINKLRMSGLVRGATMPLQKTVHPTTSIPRLNTRPNAT